MLSSVLKPTETLCGELEYLETITVLGEANLTKNPFWKMIPSPTVNAYAVPVGLVFFDSICEGATFTDKEVDSDVVLDGSVFE